MSIVLHYLNIEVPQTIFELWFRLRLSSRKEMNWMGETILSSTNLPSIGQPSTWYAPRSTLLRRNIKKVKFFLG
jgi:hypothetical protein